MIPEYSLVRSKRKTVALYVQVDGSLLVRAPWRASKKLIDSFVASKEQWIAKQRLKLARFNKDDPEKAQTLPDEIIYLGKTYPVELAQTSKEQIEFDGTKFSFSRDNPVPITKVIETWFRRQAGQLLGERVSWYAQKYNLEPKRIRITSARTRWGSCSNRGTVSFSWRLIMAPIEVIDYVIVHELVHLVEKNHQKSFWGKVASILPECESYRKWLRLNGRNIMNNISI